MELYKSEVNQKLTLNFPKSIRAKFKPAPRDLKEIGFWELDVRTDLLYRSEKVNEIHELEGVSDAITIEDFFNTCHPYYRQIISETIRNCIQNETSWNLKFKIFTAKGNERGVQMIGEPVFYNKRLVRFQGLLQSIHFERKTRLTTEVDSEKTVDTRSSTFRYANHEFEAFSYPVSHDLKQPLRAIDGFLKVLVEDYSEELPQEAKRYLHRIQVNSEKMSGLTEGLLEFGKIVQLEPHIAPVNLTELFHEIIESSFYNKREFIHLGVLPEVNGDRKLLKKLFNHLLDNAVKFSSLEEQPEIMISYARSIDKKVVISIEDNGVGFDMKYAHRLFTLFQKLHSSEDFDGLGFGLPTCEKIVTLHEGKIWAEGLVDIGATFYVRLNGVD